MTSYHLNSYVNEPMNQKLSGSNNSEGCLEADMSTSDDNTSRGSSSKLSDFAEETVEVV